MPEMELNSRDKLALKTWELQDLAGWAGEEEIYIGQTNYFTNLWKIITVLSAMRP